MIEVMLAFHSEHQATMLLDTAERWRKTKNAYPTIIQVPEEGFELKRRVLAENLAKTDTYILCDILCVPAMPNFIETIEKRFLAEGMAGLTLVGETEKPLYPTGIRVCRKGVVEKWPQMVTETYDKEHAEAVRRAGKRVEIYPDIVYLHLNNAEEAN